MGEVLSSPHVSQEMMIRMIESGNATHIHEQRECGACFGLGFILEQENDSEDDTCPHCGGMRFVVVRVD
jgi:DNA-directed RNA polymerase subunit RPC12/RpoP